MSDAELNLVLIGAGIFGSVALVLSIIGSFRKQKIKDSWSDPHNDLVQHLTKKHQELANLSWPDYKQSKPDFEKVREVVEQKLLNDKKSIPSFNPVGIFELYSFMREERIKEIVFITHAQDTIDTHIESVKNLIPDFELDQKVKHNFYYNKDTTYRKIHDQTEEWGEAISRYRTVMNEIDEAQSAVSSAQTMEVVDMFSKNKGISVLSSISNSSASGEIRDINPAINSLKSQLEKLSESQPQLAKEIEVSDTLDLITDLAFDFSFDFMSVFSYMKLSSAGSDLSSLEESLKPLGEKIKSTYNQHTELRLKALASLE